MSKFLFANNARGTLLNPITNAAVALTLNAGQGALFPAPGGGQAFRFTLIDNLGNIEICECTGVAGDVFNPIVRGKEGTVPLAFAAGSKVSLRVTKEILESLRDGANLGTMAQQNANGVAVTGGTMDSVAITNGTFNGEPVNLKAPFPRSYLAGFGMVNNAGSATTKIDVAAGECRDTGNDINIIFAGLVGKDLTAPWAVGANAGMLATGVAVANGTYHIFAIRRTDTGVVDIAADSSVTGANIAGNTDAHYTQKRRIGSILRESGNIVAFSQNGDEFLRTTAVLDVQAVNPGTGAVNRTLSVPTGVKMRAIMNTDISFGASGDTGLLSSLDETDQAPMNNAAPLGTNGQGTNQATMVGRMEIRTDTSARIRSRVNGSDGNVSVQIATIGWRDDRGRND